MGYGSVQEAYDQLCDVIQKLNQKVKTLENKIERLEFRLNIVEQPKLRRGQ